MFSIHGLLRAENMEMGRDADTGGQIKYVVELANHLSMSDEIKKVDLFTRLISDKTVSKDYSKPVEQVNKKFRIIRIQCGGKKYIRKELLWLHLDEYVDKTIKFIKRKNCIPDIVHGHYADAGYVARHLSEIFGIPFIFTGHSLGRPKKESLLLSGMKEADIERRYKISTRISAEEESLNHADFIVTSTNQEAEKQYGMYENKKLPGFHIIPPGLDLDKFYPFYHDMMPVNQKDEKEIYARASVMQELNRFFLHPDKPIILSLCRPDKRKNITGLIKAYGEDLELQIMANLAVFAGIRKDIHMKEENERDVLTEILLLMDKYDLYGKIAIPKKHDFEYEVPELYRVAAEKKGVFVNSALTEPFGLTLLEASACGLPIIAPDDGGPRDIIKNCKNGIIVDTTDSRAIGNAIKKIITDSIMWEDYSKNGIVNVRKHYTWEAHAKKSIALIMKLTKDTVNTNYINSVPMHPIGKRLANLNNFIFTDIDNTLIGKTRDGLDEFIEIIKKEQNQIGFAVATGRTIDSALEYLKRNKAPDPDIIVSSVGSEIYYVNKLIYDIGWDTHISHKWDRKKIKHVLKEFKFLTYQEEDTQRKYKISYFMKPDKACLPMIHHCLHKNKLQYNLIYSHGQFLDILPHRASKGKALRYLSYKWEIPLENILVCGDSGNDEEMLRGDPLGVVVSNYSKELENLKGSRNVYFSGKEYAGGIVEGINHYKFIEKARGNDSL